MKLRIVLNILALSLASCATLLNQPYRNITVHTTEPSRIVHKFDTLETQKNKAYLAVRRQKEPLTIDVLTDSTRKTIEVKPRNSFMYWANICNYGIGFFIDKNDPKRYSYPKRIYINSAEPKDTYFLYDQANDKGALQLHISLPHINQFQMKPENEPSKNNTGFWGLALGLDYFHSNNQFLNLGVAGIADFFVPLPAAVDIEGEYELMYSRHISLSNNHQINRFNLGYGLAIAKNTWEYRFYEWGDTLPSSRNPITKSHNAWGFIFPASYQCGSYFDVGLVYRPTFFTPQLEKKFTYEHSLSIEFAWKFKL